uniref:Uncharacterized protein n=1 Tax=Aegilops tauschii subsp. strangulata TaxID=200361 RepID=A0A453ML52_AEGTS
MLLLSTCSCFMSVFTASWLGGLACIFSTSLLFQILVRPCSNGGGLFFCPQSPNAPSILSSKDRTAYHFQPPKNWINVIYLLSDLVCSV